MRQNPSIRALLLNRSSPLAHGLLAPLPPSPSWAGVKKRNQKLYLTQSAEVSTATWPCQTRPTAQRSVLPKAFVLHKKAIHILRTNASNFEATCRPVE